MIKLFFLPQNASAHGEVPQVATERDTLQNWQEAEKTQVEPFPTNLSNVLEHGTAEDSLTSPRRRVRT